MERTITNKLPEYRQRNFPGSSEYEDVKDPRTAIPLKSDFPVFEQILVTTGKEIKNRTQLLSDLNRSVLEFLVVMESGPLSSNSDSPFK